MNTPSRHVSQVLRATPETVYAFAADVDNLPRWASGVANQPVTRDGDGLVVDSPMGAVTVRFVPRNTLGVLDHDVTLPSGETVNNPLRVVAHPEGSEAIFTIRRLGLSEDEFDRDTATVSADLQRLRNLVEGTAGA